MLEHGKVVRKEFFREVSAADEAWDVEEMENAAESAEDVEGYDVPRLKRGVESDLLLLREMRDAAVRAEAHRDPKLLALVEELATILEGASRDGIDEVDVREKSKVLIFSHYEDTVDWLEEHVGRLIGEDARLAPYFARSASVSGQETRGGVSRAAAIEGFAPKSAGAAGMPTEDRYDLLLSTDVLAEGVNFQQCRNVINFDLPWNPMRLVQRHGRVDRIGSPHERVFLRTFFPDRQLDALLALEERVRRKLAQAARSVGVEDSPIEGGEEGGQAFTETREEIEKLRRENPEIFEFGGTKGAAQTGEEYRQELRGALQRHPRMKDLPWRIGSGMRKGKEPGIFFCARVGERVYLRFVSTGGGGEGGALPEIVSEVGTCLRLIECTEETPRVHDPKTREDAFHGWNRARESIFEAWRFETDPRNLQPRVRPLN